MNLRNYGTAARVGFLAAAVVFGLSGCGKSHDRGALWKVVHGRCAPDAAHKPCTVYDEKDGYALLKDKTGRGQYLVIPTQKVPGVEDPVLLKPETPNYFAEAWAERGHVAQSYGFEIPDAHLSMAINSRPGRTQDQLHIHLDCLTAYARAELDKNMITETWSLVSLYGHPYRARIVPSLDPSPFRVIAADDMSIHTLVITPAKHGGFILLDDMAHVFDHGSGEELQDHECHLDDPHHKTMIMDGMDMGEHPNGMM
ncbi:CDP-diacylglycerol diphosphatase [Gluconobacter sp. R75690]|uniref:CDP-diacylglycerol diphosphatase n=1 Tax=Gluconobacter TaxID=441 RepID=UPI00188B4326|nr:MULTISPECIES: CDP-diacylglycerol diphosphatase [unclassified Gluconobacter]MBF0849752.1 CDP-diacylglycerol diphosphatase [Gluconobacter sp. R75690]MBF0878019.1 CDP-diacylglycerol diphosphatase [Gluconobacter sp. R75828]